MGVDKAGLEVDGVHLAARIARELALVCNPVTVIGLEPLEGYPFTKDQELYQGPLSALAASDPSHPFIFIASCDLPLFEAEVVSRLYEWIGDFEACVPECEGRMQPLCALYRSSALESLRELASAGEKRLMVWVQGLSVRTVPDEELPNPKAIRSANTPEELAQLLG